jgi:hypothetical protein
MNMRTLFLMMLASLSFSAAAFADPATLNVSIGGSVPKDPSGQTLLEKAGPATKASEKFVIRFTQPKNITSLRITAHSASRKGKVLVSAATAYRGAAPTILDGLSSFAKAAGGGKIENNKGLVMMGDAVYVEVLPNAPFSRIELSVQGLISSDASFLLQIGLDGAITPAEFLITRSNTGDVLGTLVNESSYAKFTADQVKGLMALSVEPSADDLAGHTYSCTSYTKTDSTRADFKTRVYSRGAAGELVSQSDAEPAGAVWAHDANGLALTIANHNGCGAYNTYNVARMTGSGNLVSEIVLDLENYISLCAAAGYDTTSTRELEAYSTFPSLLNSKYVVGSYEFCRLTK